MLIGDSRLETDEREKLVAVIGLHVLHYYLFHTVDKKTFKVLWELHKRVRINFRFATVIPYEHVVIF